MDFVVYAVKLPNKILINITHDPAVDYTFYKSADDEAEVYVLTPGLSVTRAYFIMEDIKKRLSTVNRLLHGNGAGIRIAAEMVKLSANLAGVKAYKKPAVISGSIELPSEYEMQMLHNLLKGKIMTYSKLLKTIDGAALYIESKAADVLQLLYLKDKLKITAPYYTDEHGKELYCSCCGHGINIPFDGDAYCKGCGKLVEENEPVYCVPYLGKSRPNIRMKTYGNLTFYESSTALELCSFMEDDSKECLLWSVPGIDFVKVINNAVRKSLAAGGRVLVSSPCPKRDMDTAQMQGVDICDFDSIGGHYCSYDLVVLVEPSNTTGISAEKFHRQSIRALRDGGKLVICTSAPDYETFQRANSGASHFIAMPVHRDGSLSSEPRVLTYRGLSEKNLFIPKEVGDFISWTISKKSEATIVVPGIELVGQIEHKLKRLNTVNIPVVPYTDVHRIHGSIIIFFTDRTEVFNEKILLSISMPGDYEDFKDIEVLYVGTAESDEMYNVKNMMRQFNKRAWEKGYIKG